MARAFIFILDSFGIGGAPDAKQYGDLGANTLARISNHCFADRKKGLDIPNLAELGLYHAAQMASDDHFLDQKIVDILQKKPKANFGAASEVSKGKDTPSGHWEIVGQPVMFDWDYFPNQMPAFPDDLAQAICTFCEVDNILGNQHMSGTDAISEFGERHIKSGQPICYTSVDSVLQIAAHESHFGLKRLYDLCQFIRLKLDQSELNIGRVIARPFVGKTKTDFTRTGNRRDYSVPPPGPTLLNLAQNDGRDVISIGKISDIYAHSGVTIKHKATGNMALFDATLNAMQKAKDGDLLMTNFVDFDMLYGHRRDISGYAHALEIFDKRLPELKSVLHDGDLVIITADHGCDPGWEGTDHTRERVPILAFGPNIASKNIGIRNSFADIGASVAQHLGLEVSKYGASFL